MRPQLRVPGFGLRTPAHVGYRPVADASRSLKPRPNNLGGDDSAPERSVKYDERADDRSWQAMLNFVEEVLV